MTTPSVSNEANVRGVNGNIVTIDLPPREILKNEVAYVRLGEERLKSEVLRIFEDRADLQVFEETEGIQVGDRVEMSGDLLSVALGPGLLGTVYDGLQNPLVDLAELDGFFPQRGRVLSSLDEETLWKFEPVCKKGDRLRAGETLGHVQEKMIRHRIMVPFALQGEVEVLSVESGKHKVTDPIVRVRDAGGQERTFSMKQFWPVRRPLPEMLLKKKYVHRDYPSAPLTTTIRLIDTFFPIAKGGTACIPGPFGAGKTVLQGLIARYSPVDVVIFVACGERAGEVVETIQEFGEMEDPRTGRPLMDRTVIICNTSSMPVPAREASIYTGITLGEYYRQMGLDVLLLADSTSRWAQAMRETSGRLEEIPGEDAYPAYLDSAIRGVYERAGLISLSEEECGSLTMIGTVSPAGGNFEEPVTQATLSTVKAFLGLSYDRAYKRFYPAIDPLMSWSRYFKQLEPYYREEISSDWSDSVRQLQELLREGNQIDRMMQVTGEEGITLEDFVKLQKATMLDMAYLQQDAFDPVDVSVPFERQREQLELLKRFLDKSFSFDDKNEVRKYFTHVTGLFKNLNFTETETEEYRDLRERIEQALEEA
jgi:V/A-type H+-transporting ATPase subunit A